MTFLEGRTCSVCGVPITDDNPDGVGFGCRKHVIARAKAACFKEVKGLDLWIAKAKLVKDTYIKEFEGVKFRNAFKKSFYESMLTAERISKKQLEIMLTHLQYKFICFDFWEEVECPMREKFFPDVECPELYASKIAIYRLEYLNSKHREKDI